MAAVNVVSARFVTTFPGTCKDIVDPLGKGRRLQGIGGSITVGLTVEMILQGPNWLVATMFCVLDGLPDGLDALLGLPWMSQHHVTIDTKHKTVQVESDYDVATTDVPTMLKSSIDTTKYSYTIKLPDMWEQGALVTRLQNRYDQLSTLSN